MSDLAVSPSQASRVIKRAIKAQRPIFVWGPPGIGKSDLVSQITNQLPNKEGKVGNNFMIDLRLALMEPTDLRGFPYLDDVKVLKAANDANAVDAEFTEKEMRWAPPTDLPSHAMAAQYDVIVLFLDELNSAMPSVQSAGYQLILNRRIGEYVLPDNVVMVAAGNREKDNGTTYKMPNPLANRFRHIEMKANAEDWIKWATHNGVHSDIIGYISYEKGSLFDDSPGAGARAFATPRSWMFVNEMLQDPDFDLEDEYIQKVEVGGAIGDGIASKFVGHRQVANTLPDIQEIFSGKVTALDPSLKKHVSVLYSLAITFARDLKDMHDESGELSLNENTRIAFNNAMMYCYTHLQKEMTVLFLKTLLQEYGVAVNIKTDMTPKVIKIFQEDFVKFIVRRS